MQANVYALQLVYTCLRSIFQDNPGNQVPERLHSGFCWELRMMEVTVTKEQL